MLIMGYMAEYISLADWAKENKIDYNLAKDWARRGKLRGIAIKKPILVDRLVIPKGYKVGQKVEA